MEEALIVCALSPVKDTPIGGVLVDYCDEYAAEVTRNDAQTRSMSRCGVPSQTL